MEPRWKIKVKEAILHILKDKSCQYETILSFLTANQFNLLKAIAQEQHVSQPQSQDFLRKHELPSASSIKKALYVLNDKDLTYQSSKGYIVYDRFLDLWLRRRFYS